MEAHELKPSAQAHSPLEPLSDSGPTEPASSEGLPGSPDSAHSHTHTWTVSCAGQDMAVTFTSRTQVERWPVITRDEGALTSPQTGLWEARHLQVSNETSGCRGQAGWASRARLQLYTRADGSVCRERGRHYSSTPIFGASARGQEEQDLPRSKSLNKMRTVFVTLNVCIRSTHTYADYLVTQKHW